MQRTKADYAMLRRIVARTHYKGSWPLFIGSCIVAFCITLALNSASALFEQTWVKATVNVSIIFCLTKWLYNRLWRKVNATIVPEDPFLATKTFSICPEGLREEDANSTTSAKWSAIRKLQETRDYILFYMTRNQAFIVPKRALGDKGKAKAFWELAQKYWNDAQKEKDLLGTK